MAGFSPDGKKVSFLSDRSGSKELWICGADGSNPIQLTFLGAADLDSFPLWSPDSRRLTFSTNVEGHSEVYVLNASGGKPRRLTSTASYARNPTWSRDGQWILFDSASPTPGIYRVPAEGGPVVLLTTKGGYAPFESPDGKFIYSLQNTADGRVLVRAPVVGGEAQRVLDHFSDFQLEEGGIYFVPKPEPKCSDSLQFLNTTTGKIQRIASFEKPVAWFWVSPDRRQVLYTPVSQGGSDLMLVENIH